MVDTEKRQVRGVPFLKRNGKYVFVDSFTLKPLNQEKEYDSVTESDYVKEQMGELRFPRSSENKSISYKVYLNQKEGIVDLSGNEVFSPIYDRIWYTSKERTIVLSSRKKGIVDSSGGFVIQPIYEEIYDFQEE